VRYIPSKGAVACVILLIAGSISAANSEEEYVKSYSVTGRATVHARVDGSVQVITSDAPKVDFRVTYEKSNWGFLFGASPHVDSRQSGNVIELTARSGWSFPLSFGNTHMRVEVHMPRNADLELDTGDGGIEVSSLSGNVRLHTSDGGIKATDLVGTIELHSNDGGITVDRLKGDLKLHTNDGTIGADHLDGKCEVWTNDGSVDVAGRFDFLDVKSNDGSVTTRIESGSQMSGDWRIRADDGGINLALPKDFKANLDVGTDDGHITLDFPVEVQGSLSKSRIRGTLNGGGPALVVHTSDGAVHVTGI
jgi:DUF4097 and DUF4098 domain-containing protein YvlB